MALIAIVLVASGCVGSIDRDEFAATVQARGGGLSGDRLLDAVRSVERRVGEEVLVRSASLSLLSVSLDVSPTSRPDEVDFWFDTNGLRGPQPETSITDPDELGSFFTADLIDPLVVEASIDEALARTDIRDPYATSLSVSGAPGGTDYVASVVVTNERTTEVWTFGADGVVERSGG